MADATITPTAIDAHVRADWVKVNGRHRKDLGDIAALAASIREVGLLHPLTLTRDGTLVAGERRLAACRSLGWDLVPVRYVDFLDDAALLLHVERDENTCRKDMLPSELVALGMAIEELERPAAEARRTQELKQFRSDPRIGTELRGSSGETRQIVSDALGVSPATYGRAKAVVVAASAPDASAAEKAALAFMDQTGRIHGAYNQMREAKQEPRTEHADDHDETEPEPAVPAPRDNRTMKRRRSVIEDMAATGHTSDQIGRRLGVRAAWVRDLARRNDIAIPADDVLGLRTRTRIDSNRIIRETVNYLADAQTALCLVDFAELDLGEVDAWTASLTTSLRVLSLLNKRMKEMVQ